MKTKIITFTLGALIGGIAIALITKDNEPEAAVVTPTQQLPRIPKNDDAKKIASLEAKIAELESIPAVENVTEEVPKLPSGIKVTSISNGSDMSEADRKKMHDRMEKYQQNRIEKRIKSQLATLKSKLNLNDEQVEDLRELLEREVSSKKSDIGSLIGSALSGESSVDSEPSNEVDFDSEFAALLDEDQREAYAEYTELQSENYVEASANRELAKLLSNVTDLTKDQKDRAFDEFSQLAQDEVATSGVPEPKDGFSFDMGRMIQQRTARADALSDILSPEQSESYNAANSGSTMTMSIDAPMEIEADQDE